ncbi:MAG: sxtJ [Candidatus Lambdaproteobacteria bacterium]|nr:sxtJ [Candidatus Lambdaproteobacteria bacterium]
MKITFAGRGELRRFGITTGLIVALLFGLALPWLLERPWPRWPFALGGALLALGVLLPRVLAPVHWLWMGFGQVMGAINTRIVLSFLFYGVFLPTGLVGRLFGYDPMARRRDGTEATYRVPATERPGTHMERPF